MNQLVQEIKFLQRSSVKNRAGKPMTRLLGAVVVPKHTTPTFSDFFDDQKRSEIEHYTGADGKPCMCMQCQEIRDKKEYPLYGEYTGSIPLHYEALTVLDKHKTPICFMIWMQLHARFPKLFENVNHLLSTLYEDENEVLNITATRQKIWSTRVSSLLCQLVLRVHFPFAILRLKRKNRFPLKMETCLSWDLNQSYDSAFYCEKS